MKKASAPVGAGRIHNAFRETGKSFKIAGWDDLKAALGKFECKEPGRLQVL
jgi:hypothetical protein